MRTENLQYFITLVRCGSMNKAAQQLFITQPALSSAISALEKEIGVTLIKRQQNGIALTTAGKQIYQDSLYILDNISNWTHLAEINEATCGSVAVSSFETVSYLLLPYVISRLNKNYPGIDIISENFITDSSLFYNDFYDIIITPSVNNELFSENKRYSNEIIFHDFYVAFVSSENKLAKKSYVTMEELSKNKFAFTAESRFLKYMPEDFVQEKNILYLNQKESIMSTVSKNVAVTIFPYIRQYHNYYIEKKQIVAVPISDLRVSYDHLLIYPTKYRISPCQQIVLTYLKDAYAAFKSQTLLQRKTFFNAIGLEID